MRQAQVDAGDRAVTATESERTRRRLRSAVSCGRRTRSGKTRRFSCAKGTRLRTPLVLGFVEEQRAKGRAVDSVCKVLRGKGVQVAARTYRGWKKARPSSRDLTDTVIADVLRSKVGKPESLYGRRKMTAHLRREGLTVPKPQVGRLMRQLGFKAWDAQ